MMIVMPALTKGEQTDHPFVAALIVRLERASSEGVTHRIDAPGHMVCQEDTHQTTPEEACPASDHKGNDEREHGPEDEGAAAVADLLPAPLL